MEIFLQYREDAVRFGGCLSLSLHFTQWDPLGKTSPYQLVMDQTGFEIHIKLQAEGKQ
jgi:hypothetical protein